MRLFVHVDRDKTADRLHRAQADAHVLDPAHPLCRHVRGTAEEYRAGRPEA